MPIDTSSVFGQTICVTGAGGFIASWLVKLLLEKGYTVKGTVRNPDDPKNGHLREIEGAKEGLILCKADLLNYESLKEAINGCHGVFHIASPVTDDPKQNAKQIVPVKNHFHARVTYRGSTALNKIKKKFEESGLIERVKQTPFRQFFEEEELQFSGALYHSMMLHKNVCSKDTEVQFCFGSSYTRFGLTDYAMIIDLNFSKEPSNAELKEHCTSDRILDNHFNSMSEKLLLKQLEDAFVDAMDVDEIFKLGLCCLVEGVLIAHKPKSKITVSYLRMVDDLEFFYKYPWGKVSFEKMIDEPSFVLIQIIFINSLFLSTLSIVGK